MPARDQLALEQACARIERRARERGRMSPSAGQLAFGAAGLWVGLFVGELARELTGFGGSFTS